MEEKILREILAVTKENNDILRKLNLQRRWQTYFWILKWVLIIGLAYSAYIAATPYINQAQQTINDINSFNDQAKQLQNVDQKTFTDFFRNELQKRIAP